MDRIQAATAMVSDRPLLGQMAVATCLVGGAAALSSAGIAVPVPQVGFAPGAAASAPKTPRLSAVQDVAALARMPVPSFTTAPALRALVAAAPSRAILPEAIRPSRVAIALPPSLAAPRPPRIESGAGPAALPLITIEAPAPAPALALPVAPVVPAAIAPSAAPLAPAAPIAAPVDLVLPAAAVVPAAALPGEASKLLPEAVPFRLVNPRELRGFDLAKIPGQNRIKPAGFAKVGSKAGVAKAEALGAKDKLVGDSVYHQVAVSVAGSVGKQVDVRIGADMKPSIKVGDLLALVSDRLDPDSAARFTAASSAGEYVSLASLRAAGFDVAYNAGADSISISVSD